MSNVVTLERSSDYEVRLIEANDKQVVSARRETDVRTAITRGLQEYLKQLRIDWPGGRQHAFHAVTNTHPDSVVLAAWPSVNIWSEVLGEYEAANLTPRTEKVGGDLVIRKVSEFAVNLNVDVYASDLEERVGLAAMLEDAFDPHDWSYGFTLELPYYFNARATFAKTHLGYHDSEENASQNIWMATFILNATCPQYRFVGPAKTIDVRVDTGDQEGGSGEIGPHVVI